MLAVEANRLRLSLTPTRVASLSNGSSRGGCDPNRQTWVSPLDNLAFELWMDAG